MAAVLRRFAIGLIKGAILGALFGAAISFGLGWGETEGLLGYLLAMGVGASVGLLGGKPPWAQQAWLEAILRAAGGLILGAFLYWAGTRFANVPVPVAVGPDGEAGLPWMSVPLLYATAIGALYGCLVELDNTGGKRPATASDDDDSAPAGDEVSAGDKGASATPAIASTDD